VVIGAVALGAVILYAATSWLLTVCRYLIANRAEVTQKLLRSVARGSSGAWLRGSPKNAGGEARIRFASVLRLCRCSNRDGLRALSGAASVGLLRSMRCGKPVISCDGGVRETEAYGGVRRQQYLFGGRHCVYGVRRLASAIGQKQENDGSRGDAVR